MGTDLTRSIFGFDPSVPIRESVESVVMIGLSFDLIMP